MIQFITNISLPENQPDIRPNGAEDGDIYTLMQPWAVEWEDNGIKHSLWIDKGFRLDGASGARLYTTLLGLHRDGPQRAGVLIHDFAYHHQGDMNAEGGVYLGPLRPAKPIVRKKADELLLAACEHVGIKSVRRWFMGKGVRILGGRAWRT